MAEALELKAWARPRSGKGGARSVRREGRIPGILYGGGEDPVQLAVDDKAIRLQLLTGHFQSTIFTLDVEGKKTRVIPRGVQLDPVRDFPIHVDFMRVAKDALVTVAVPVHFLNEAASPGIKRGGRCSPADSRSCRRWSADCVSGGSTKPAATGSTSAGSDCSTRTTTRS